MKKKALKTLKKLAKEKGWQVNWEEVNSWHPKPKSRSFYTFITLPNKKRAFYKYSLHFSLRQNFLREAAFTKYANKHFPLLVPKIYDSSKENEKDCWFLVEALNMKKGVIVKGEETKILKNNWTGWILKGISQIQSLPLKSKFPAKLFKLSYHQDYQGTFSFYKERIKQRLAVIGKNRLVFAKPFPSNRVRQFVKSNEKSIKSAENKKPILLQGDFAPNNLYFNVKKKRVMFLDWEWASINKNRMIGKSFDFANLYLRLWQNKSFQQEFLKKYYEKKMALPKQIQIAVILQCVNQLNGLFAYLPQEGEDYLKQHASRLVESLEQVLKLGG